MPICAALQSIANETIELVITEIQTQIIAEKGTQPRVPVRKKFRSAPVYEGEPVDETDDIDEII